MGYDKTCFAAAIINLAVKKFLTIEEEDDEYTLKKTGTKVNMAPGESALAKKLFAGYGMITLKQSNHARIKKALDAHEASLTRNYEKIYFLSNSLFFFLGVGLTIIVLATSISTMPLSTFDPAVLFMLVWLTFWSFAVIALITAAVQAWKRANGLVSTMSALFATAFSIPFIAGEIFVGLQLVQETSISLVFMILLFVLINWVFYVLLKAPTRAGRKLLDQVEGFRQYIDLAEKHELDYKYPGGKCPELFEEYLPYTMALGIEQQWGEQFADVLKNINQPGDHYSPGWYHGSHWNSSNVGGFTSSLGSSFTSAISSSSTAPGSSSGSGGGGFSGGGGGGGGGGGW